MIQQGFTILVGQLSGMLLRFWLANIAPAHSHDGGGAGTNSSPLTV
jgi:hypothetical protein